MGCFVCTGTAKMERMAVVLDSEYVYKGITEWLVKWHHNGWRVKNREVGHKDLWEHIFLLRREAGSLLQLVWTPSHMQVVGNDRADALSEEGRLQHPHNKKRRSEEPRPLPLWEEVGLLPMRSDVSSSVGGGPTKPPVVAGAQSSAGGSLTSSEGSATSTGSSIADWVSASSDGGVELQCQRQRSAAGAQKSEGSNIA